MELPAGWLVVLTTVTPSLLIAYRYSLSEGVLLRKRLAEEDGGHRQVMEKERMWELCQEV